MKKQMPYTVVIGVTCRRRSGSYSAGEKNSASGIRIRQAEVIPDHNRDADAAAVEVSDAAEQHRSEYIPVRNRAGKRRALLDNGRIAREDSWR